MRGPVAHGAIEMKSPKHNTNALKGWLLPVCECLTAAFFRLILANAIASMALHCLDWTRVNSKRVCKSPKAIRYLGLTSE
jgi:hypothetical protein